MVKKLLFWLENSIFYVPSKSQKITEKICTTELVRSLGLFLGCRYIQFSLQRGMFYDYIGYFVPKNAGKIDVNWHFNKEISS